MDVPLSITQQAKADGAGNGRVRFQPSVPGQVWQVELVTVTALNATIQVIRNGLQVIDSTANDPRPTVTSDSTYALGQGELLDVVWTGAPAGQVLVATLTGTLAVGSA